MAKRFTNTNKWDDDWFLDLPPKYKAAWSNLCDTCDGGTGIKKVSFRKISNEVGEPISRDGFDKYFGDRIHWMNHETVWIHGYLSEQFKGMSSKNRAHVNMAKKVVSLLDGQVLSEKSNKSKENLLTLIRESVESQEALTRGSPEAHRIQDTGNRIQEKISEGGVGETKQLTAVTPSRPITSDLVKTCVKTWLSTLEFLGQKRDFALASEESAIARAIAIEGAEVVDLALRGARFEPGGPDWKPREHVDIIRVLQKDKEGKDRIQRFVGYAVQARTAEAAKKERAREVQRSHAAARASPMDSMPEQDADKVREIRDQINRSLRGAV